MVADLLKRFYAEENGQGITEYGAVLAFIAVLIAVAFGIVNGTLKTAVSNAFSVISSSLTKIVTTAS